MKIRASQLSKQEKIETLDALYTAASSLKNRADMKLFLRDLLTESERIMLGRRIRIAHMLLSDATYDDINMRMKVGFDTIRRVERWLSDQLPGYEKAIKEMREEMRRRDEKRRVGRMYADPSWRGVFARLKKKYPLHFLLFPWPDEHRPLSTVRGSVTLKIRTRRKTKTHQVTK